VEIADKTQPIVNLASAMQILYIAQREESTGAMREKQEVFHVSLRNTPVEVIL
jgi:hypothetical protein